jgi:NAD(P)-dependent dehydrogenase (short-subunit alcohol dehydrogenase family)
VSFSLSGKTVLVTGASGHLGTAIARGLAEAGAHLLVNGRTTSRVRSLVTKISSMGGSAESAVFDVCSESSIAEFFEGKRDQPLHGLVNNAYSGRAGSIVKSTPADFRNSYEIGLIAPHNLVLAALPMLKLAAANGGASVINIGSMYGMVSPDLQVYDDLEYANPPYYGAAKAALLQWTRYAACEFGCQNIRFNSISPGPFPSDKVARENPNFVARLAEKVPMGRIAAPEELIGPVVFLASDASSFVNGSNIVVDGGWTCW